MREMYTKEDDTKEHQTIQKVHYVYESCINDTTYTRRITNCKNLA